LALGLLGVFLAVFLGMSLFNSLLMQPLRRRRQLRQRLDGPRLEQVQARLFKEKAESGTGLALSILGGLANINAIRNLQDRLFQADILWSPNKFLCLIGTMSSLGFVLGLMQGHFVVGLIAALVLGLLPLGFLRWRQNRKARRFEGQMPDAMELLARSLRAGHTLPSAIELAGQEIPPPMGTEMRLAFEEQRLGIGMPIALQHMTQRVASQDLRYFVTAVLIQTETGGNLTEVMEKIGYIIRERLKFKGKLRGLTAEGRFSALILGCLPLAVFVALYFLNRSYIMVLFEDPMGQKLMVGGIISILLGAALMKKIIEIKV